MMVSMRLLQHAAMTGAWCERLQTERDVRHVMGHI